MKAFITGIVTLILLITAVIINSILITNKADRMLNKIKELPFSVGSSNADDLSKEWKDCKKLISASVSRKKVDEIDDAIRQMEIYISTKNEFNYLSCREHLLCLFERLRETESFSLGRVF